jgi:glycosyltransferase involved in cell wall biosynthesis
MNETISLIIPAYNAERYLCEAIASVKRQTHPVQEIIVVDDGSTDGTATLVKSIAGVTLLQQPNAGVAEARNAGVQAARGTLLAFLDADDMWTPDAITSNLTILASQHDVHGVIGLSEEFVSPDLPAEIAKRYAPRASDRTALLCGAMLIRREVMNTTGPFQTAKQVGDFVEWFLRAQRLRVCITRNPCTVLRRRIHGNNKMLQGSFTSAIYLQFLHKHIQARKAQS